MARYSVYFLYFSKKKLKFSSIMLIRKLHLEIWIFLKWCILMYTCCIFYIFLYFYIFYTFYILYTFKKNKFLYIFILFKIWILYFLYFYNHGIFFQKIEFSHNLLSQKTCILLYPYDILFSQKYISRWYITLMSHEKISVFGWSIKQNDTQKHNLHCKPI